MDKKSTVNDSLRSRLIELAEERYEAEIQRAFSRPLRRSGSADLHCDFCPLDPNTKCIANCADAIQKWQNQRFGNPTP